MAGPFQDGQAAYARGDYATALKLMRPLADQGNAAAQDDLGEMYHSRASSQRVRLGILTGPVPPGESVLRNYTEAVKWYRLSADQGNPAAQDDLGYMYNFGDGVPLNYVEAAKWFRLAADQGLAVAQQHLAEMYLSGHGVPLNLIRAYIWDDLAAARSRALDAAAERDVLATRMTPAQIARAQKLAAEWKPVNENPVSIPGAPAF